MNGHSMAYSPTAPAPEREPGLGLGQCEQGRG